jgi:dimeric dUTPase (all-alpha-NTP-PPase superfamily)
MSTPDRLQEIFARQAAFQAKLVRDRHLEAIAPMEWVQRASLALIVEVGEVLEEARYKWWKHNPPPDPAALHEELVDVFHFFVTMCLAAGMTADDLYAGYLAKQEENIRRQDGLSDRPEYRV